MNAKLGDEFTFGYCNTDGSNRFEGSYTFPVNPRNGTVGFNYRITNNKIIEAPFDQLDIKVNSREYEFTFRQPVIQKATPNSVKNSPLVLGLPDGRKIFRSLGLGYSLNRYSQFAGRHLARKRHVFSIRIQTILKRRQRSQSP